MKNALSERYSSAFIEAFGSQGCQKFLEKEGEIRALYADRSFLELIKNPFIGYSKKFEMLNSVLGYEDAKIKNALLLLAKSQRMEFLPEILDDIHTSISLEDKAHAVVYCNTKMSAETLEKISKILSEKLNLVVEIEERLWDKDGIKCVIDELDLEVSFSKEIFLSSLQNHILDTFRKGV